MRLSLDPLDPHYRPFLIYGFFSLIKIMSGLLLRAAGFYACRTTGGLRYFYRPPKRESDNNSGSNKLPLIFLHGIAPGGLAFYIPMLFSLGGDGRPLFLFENPDITFCIFGGNPLKEHDTVQGIWEAVDHQLSSVHDVSVVGHSFGSCPVTWLIHSTNSARIRQIVLVDPVSICLSEPDVMHNFLYKRDVLLADNMKIKIGVISNEIFTQHYLRRHFAWYNSELWLEDLPKEAKVLVCLSERDLIVPVKKVQQQIRRRPEIEFLLWEDAGHAHCVTRPKTWRQMQILMRRQEQQIIQESSFTDVYSKKEW
jgi:pimeloyl-ACP methyl ester carboxylesterase